MELPDTPSQSNLHTASSLRLAADIRDVIDIRLEILGLYTFVDANGEDSSKLV